MAKQTELTRGNERITVPYGPAQLALMRAEGWLPAGEQQPGAAESEPVTAVDGIGPKTAEALAAAGVETVAQLLAADADELAAQLENTSADKVRGWQEAAK